MTTLPSHCLAGTAVFRLLRGRFDPETWASVSWETERIRFRRLRQASPQEHPHYPFSMERTQTELGSFTLSMIGRATRAEFPVDGPLPLRLTTVPDQRPLRSQRQ